jgi:hypothetical protein
MEAAATNGAVATKADLDFHLAVARASGDEYFEAVLAGGGRTGLRAGGGRTGLRDWRRPAQHVYFDFSGYSDMAIGLARLFGIMTLTRPLEHLRIVQTERVVLFQAIEARDKGRRPSIRRGEALFGHRYLADELPGSAVARTREANRRTGCIRRHLG